MTELDEAARAYVERERAAWTELPPPAADAPARAFAEGARRRAALTRARVLGGAALGVVVAVTLAALLASRHGVTPRPVPPAGQRSVVHVGLAASPSRPANDTTPSRAPASAATLPVAAPSVAVAPPMEADRPPPTPARIDSTSSLGVSRRRGATPTDPATAPSAAGAAASTGGAPASEDALQAEFRLLREARIAIRDGHLDQALAICAEHASRHPNGVLTPERRALERRARCMLAERSGSAAPEGCR